MLKRLAGCIREYKTASILSPVIVMLEVVIECIIPFLTAELVNEIKAGCELNELLKFGAILLVLAACSLTCGWLAGHFCATAACGFAKNLRKDLFYNVQRFSFGNIDKFSTSSLVTRLTTDVANVQMAYMMLVRTAFRSPFMLIFAFFMAFYMGGKMAWVFAVVIPILGFGLFLIARKAMPIFRKVFRKYDNLNNSVQENIQGMRVVKAYVREDREIEKFGVAAEDVCADFTRAEKLLAFNNPLMQLCLHVVMLVVIFFGSQLIINSGGAELDVGQLSALLTYGMQILMSLMMLSMIFVMITMSAESARRIVEVLDEQSTVTNPQNPRYEVADGSLDFEKVSFKYSAKAKEFALQEINLHIKSGQTVGIIGGTGSSKTTLIQLISRLYDVTEGSVKVGGVDVREYDLETLRNQVAVVLQKNVLFSGSIKENLRWGNLEATDEELIHACKLACAHEFITQFPDGYDTHIEQGGTNVSGGQKQRLCIARALLKKPKVLILDDSTSAVDTHTDAMIRKAFREEIPGTTKLIIAQRISSVEDADVIIVMNGGRIDDIGNHAELLARNAIYQEVYTSQNKGGATDGQE
ncbi:MAG: ABC transporter ATP-binding protein [Clostridia bacterium]|nr:ABC transporter ATP-binding protein [Clostridia bacterium]